jgi:hypothetical protein
VFPSAFEPRTVSWCCTEDSGKRFGTKTGKKASATTYKRQQCLEHAVVSGHFTFFNYRAVHFVVFSVLVKTLLENEQM